MGNFKIKNNSKNLDKRSPNFNSAINLDYIENMIKKTVSIQPEQEIVMILSSLPQNINHLRMKNMIIVEEINEFQLKKLQNNKPLQNQTNNVVNKKSKIL